MFCRHNWPTFWHHGDIILTSWWHHDDIRSPGPDPSQSGMISKIDSPENKTPQRQILQMSLRWSSPGQRSAKNLKMISSISYQLSVSSYLITSFGKYELSLLVVALGTKTLPVKDPLGPPCMRRLEDGEVPAHPSALARCPWARS